MQVAKRSDKNGATSTENERAKDKEQSMQAQRRNRDIALLFL